MRERKAAVCKQGHVGKCCMELNEKYTGKKIHIVSYGKAAYTMARTASKHVKVAGGLIVAPKGQTHECNTRIANVHYAAHPIPDRCSAAAARATIKYLEQIDPKEHVLFLISGGGSSLLSLPPKSIKFVDLLLCNTSTFGIRCKNIRDKLHTATHLTGGRWQADLIYEMPCRRADNF